MLRMAPRPSRGGLWDVQSYYAVVQAGRRACGPYGFGMKQFSIFSQAHEMEPDARKRMASRIPPGAADVPRYAIKLPPIPSMGVRVGQMRESGDFGVGHNTNPYMPGSKISADKADGLLWRPGVMR